ncbi:DUF3093 domain-containing protein [Nocardioides sp. SYSU DS0663]|uniref:DUF3093 domain-containing protein n=1 Tax=Nocardioides sp. SYSU DS0663 TaxID=3416445 RepID=UPI003F4BCE48
MPGQRPTDHHERLTVPLRWWVLGAGFVVSLWLAVDAAAPALFSLAVGVVGMAVLAALLLSYGSRRVEVADGVLRAGRATIEGEHLGEVEVLDAVATRRTAGPEADARAYLATRPYVRTSVKVEITDPADRTPYWLISTRRPERLAAAIGALREAGRRA